MPSSTTASALGPAPHTKYVTPHCAPRCQVYCNYPDGTLRDWPSAYWASNLGRLVGLKQEWDPADVFSFPQSIPQHVPSV